MVVVVDTNILFSALLREDTQLAETLFLADAEFVAPQFAIVELFKYKEKITRYSHMEEVELLDMLDLLLKRIHFIQTDQLPLIYRQQAYELCKSIDIKDAPFVALTLARQGVLWTGDKKLIRGLKQQGFHHFFG